MNRYSYKLYKIKRIITYFISINNIIDSILQCKSALKGNDVLIMS